MWGLPKEPDEEFLQRRLARTAAIPPEQRSPEAAAFVAAMQLPEQIATLLPVAAAGGPALPQHSADTRRRMLLAHLLLTRATYAAPKPTPSLAAKTSSHCAPYMCALQQLATLPLPSKPCINQSSASARGSSGSDGLSEDGGGEAVLARYLLMLVSTRMQISRGAPPAALRGFQQAGALLQAHRPAVEGCLRQLAELQQSLLPHMAPLSSVSQLHFLCSCLALWAIKVPATEADLHGSSTEARRTLLPLLEQVAPEALQLGPGSPKAHLLIGECLGPVGLRQGSMGHLLRCMQLSIEQGSDFHEAAAGFFALSLTAAQLSRAAATSCPCSISLATAQAVLDAFPRAKAALKRCKGLLPQG
ncbi:hypothetical protein ABPG75_003162 [Micractinium tetrahymenae]